MSRVTALLFIAFMFLIALPAKASESSPPKYDAALAEKLGADERGMRSFVLVVLMTGPTRVPDGEARTQLFAGHMANIQRLANEEKLVFAGPLDGVDGWRGIFVFDTPDIEIARQWVATDPVIESGEMVAEYRQLYGSAALKLVNGFHPTLSKPSAEP